MASVPESQKYRGIEKEEVEIAKLFFELPKLAIQAVIFFATASAIVARPDLSATSIGQSWIGFFTALGYALCTVMTVIFFGMTWSFFSEIVRAARGLPIAGSGSFMTTTSREEDKIEATKHSKTFSELMTLIINDRYERYYFVCVATVMMWMLFLGYALLV